MGARLTKRKILSAIIAIASCVYIVFRMHLYGQDWADIDMPRFDWIQLFLLLLAQLSLLCVNMWFESKKWQCLLRSFMPISISHSLKMVLSGFASGIFTPAKIGEPVGRVMLMPKNEWGKATVLHYLGGLIQNVIIFVVGIICLSFSLSSLSMNFSFGSWAYMLVFGFLVLGLFILGFNGAWVMRMMHKIRLKSKLKHLVEEILSIPLLNVWQVFLYSLLRFLTYNFQLFLLLRFLGYDDIFVGICIVPVYFMMITLAPSFFLADLGVRGSVALFLFSNFGLSDGYIVLSVSVLWFVNQVIPALIGSAFILLRKQ